MKATEKKYVKLQVGGEIYRLRLTLGGQKRLKKEFGTDPTEMILSAPADGESMAALLDAALDWAGSGNPSVTGEELYDALVDEGYAGQGDFGKLAFAVAACSGLISQQQYEAMLTALDRALEAALTQMDGDVLMEEAVRRENPPKAG